MAGLKGKHQKVLEDESTVTLYKDSSGAWYVGHSGGDMAYHPHPMGAFRSEDAARRWADRRFPSGNWS